MVSFEAVESASDSALDTAGETAEAEVIEVTVVEVVVTVVTGADPDPVDPVGDFALDGTKGTEAGFKLDFIHIGPEFCGVRFGSGLSCNKTQLDILARKFKLMPKKILGFQLVCTPIHSNL